MKPRNASLVTCEDISVEFKPIGIKHTFYPYHHAKVCVLAEFITNQRCDVRMVWFVSNQPETPVYDYLIQFPEREYEERSAYTAIDLNALIKEDKINIFQLWSVKLFLDDEPVKEISFELKKTGYSKQSGTLLNGSRSIDLGV